MLNKPSDREFLALARLARSDDGKILMEYLHRSLADVKDRVLSIEADTQVRRMQGRGEALRDLVEALEQAPDLVSKLEHRARGR